MINICVSIGRDIVRIHQHPHIPILRLFVLREKLENGRYGFDWVLFGLGFGLQILYRL